MLTPGNLVVGQGTLFLIVRTDGLKPRGHSDEGKWKWKVSYTIKLYSSP